MPNTINYFDETDTKKLILLIKDELIKYVKKKTGYDLSQEDFTTVLKEKLEGIAANANKVEISNLVTEGNTIATIKLSDDEIFDIKVKASEVIVVDKAMSDTSENPVQNKVIKAYVDDKVSAAYRPKGSITFANIPTADMKVGDVYDISDAFTTDARFVEGAGHFYPAGTNIVWTVDSKWDVLSGFIDLSGYLLRSELVPIPAESEDPTAETLTKWWKDQFGG